MRFNRAVESGHRPRRHERARGEHRHSDGPLRRLAQIGNVMRFYLEFQDTPLATIDAKEIRKARDEYLAGKRASA